MPRFMNVGIIARLDSEAVVHSLTELIPYLQSTGRSVMAEPTIKDVLKHDNVSFVDVELMRHRCDLVIVVGGDGTMLAAARHLAGYSVPVLGVNRGNLGFLTDICPSKICAGVAEVLDGQYTSERRFLIETEVCRNGHIIARGSALNDVLLHAVKVARLIRFDLYIDKEFVYNQRSDGLIVATPTGSTAYALSGGGPILHPSLDAIVLVPMLPHTLTSRPIVVGGNANIRLVVGGGHDGGPALSCDGVEIVTCQEGDEIRLHKKPEPLILLHPKSYNFYETCRNKLGWGTKLGSQD